MTSTQKLLLSLNTLYNTQPLTTPKINKKTPIVEQKIRSFFLALLSTCFIPHLIQLRIFAIFPYYMYIMGYANLFINFILDIPFLSINLALYSIV